MREFVSKLTKGGKVKQRTFREERPDWKARLEEIEQQRHSVSLLLDGVQDVRNIGAMFRLADAAWLRKIYCYRVELDVHAKKLKRIARSTHRFIPYEELDALDAIQQLRKSADLIGLDITNNSIPYTDFVLKQETILVIGNEQEGISEEVLQLTHACIHIPMYGINTSMNVAMATGIAVYELVNKSRKLNGQ